MKRNASFYETCVKRLLDVILSGGALIVLGFVIAIPYLAVSANKKTKVAL